MIFFIKRKGGNAYLVTPGYLSYLLSVKTRINSGSNFDLARDNGDRLFRL